MILTFEVKKTMSPFQHDSSIGTLAELRPGFQAVVLLVRDQDQPVCLRLQELGLVPGASVRVLSNAGGMMVMVDEQRLCLGEALAKSVDVAVV